MKEKIIEIIGFGMEPERADLKAVEIILSFNSHIIKVFKESKDLNPTELLNELFIKL
jgi:hypothetical protein